MGDFLPQLEIFGFQGAQAYIVLGLFLLLVFYFVLILFFLLKKITRYFYKKSATFKQVILMVQVPKYETVETGKTQEPKSQQELAEKISKMETFFANIAGLKAQRGLKAEFLGRTDHFAFEIVLKGGLIYFYVVVPLNWRD